MFRFLKELYLTVFALGFKSGSSSWSPRINAGKGVFGIAVIEGLILTSAVAWIEMSFETRFLLNTGKWTMGVVFVVLYYGNYYFLVTRGYGIRFEREFSRLEQTRKSVLIVGFILLLLITIALFYFSITDYQQFFHIIPQKDNVSKF